MGGMGMRKYKRVFVIFMICTLLVGMFPMNVLASGAVNGTENGGADSNEMVIRGTNSVGDIIANELENEDGKKDDDYYITDLIVEGAAATVTLDAKEDCTLVVAIYTENEVQLLASGRARISSGQKEAVVNIESGEMPAYFTAKAYLMDGNRYSPLCEDYTTKNYTQEFQEFLAKTVDDFDREKVLNLDEDDTTNFAVYNDGVSIIEKKDGVNIVESADNKSGVYLISNADESFTSLQNGDILSYQYNDKDVIVIKVASIIIDGTTVTITADNASLEDIFSYVKIEAEGGIADCEIDDSNLEDGVTYVGREAAPEAGQVSGFMRNQIDTGVKVAASHKFHTKKAGEDGNEINLEGTVSFSAKVTVKVYLYTDYKYIETKLAVGLDGTVSMSGKLMETSLELCEFTISPMIGLYIGFTPSVLFSAKTKMEVNFSYGVVIGAAYDSKTGFQNKCSLPELSSELKVEGSIFVGLSMEPKVSIISDHVAKASIGAKAGVVVSAQNDVVLLGGSTSKRHDCSSCLDGDVEGVMAVSASVQFAGMESMEFSANILSYSKKIADFYFSLDYGEFAWTTCPHVSYKVAVTVVDTDGKGIRNAVVIAGQSDNGGHVTDIFGECSFYLPDGIHTLDVSVGGSSYYEDIDISGEAKRVRVVWKDPNIIDGLCGIGLKWVLVDDGTLEISGTGAMENYNPSRNMGGWDKYRNKIKRVVIHDGVTSIGNYAFYDCYYISDVTLPESIKSIGKYSFRSCINLTDITLPDNLKSIGNSAFSGCSRLVNIVFSENLESIGDSAFYYCKSLTEIMLPDSVTTIGSWAFELCTSLTNVRLSENLTGIKSWVFSNCYSLAGIKFPDKIERIGSYAFSSCKNLASIELPENLTVIEGLAFAECDTLSSITFPKQVTNIAMLAFYNCKDLTTLFFEGDAPTIGISSFYNVNATAYFPSGNSTWTEGKMGNYGGTINWAPFDYSAMTPIIFSKESPDGQEIADMEGQEEDDDYTGGTENDGIKENDMESENLKLDEGPDLDVSDEIMHMIEVHEEHKGLELGLEFAEELNEESIGLNEEGIGLNEEGMQIKPMAELRAIPVEITKEGEFDDVTFDGLTADQPYILLVVKSGIAEDILSPDNVLYINQKNADESGSMKFSYLPREAFEDAVAALYGGFININEAAVNIPTLIYDGAEHIPDVAVAYGGKTLLEYEDYTISGAISEIGIGSYAIKVTGCGDYTGTVIQTYGILPAIPKVSKVSNSSNGIMIEWDMVGGAEGYYIYRKWNGFDWNRIGTVENGLIGSYTDKTVSSDITYSYTVEAYVGSITSGYDNKGKAITYEIEKNDQETLACTVSFDASGGENLSKPSVTVTKGEAIGTLPTVSRKGYTFIGWYSAKSGGYKVMTTTKITKNQTLYAQWKINTYTVKFNKNKGTKLSKTSAKVDYNKKIGKLPTVQRKGYSFKGWYTAKSGGKKVTANTSITKSQALYSQWIKVIKPEKTVISRLENNKSKQMIVKISRVSGAKGYQIMYSTNQKFKSYKTETTTSLSKTIKGLKRGRTYYVKVRAYKLDSANKKVYGRYGGKNKIEISK